MGAGSKGSDSKPGTQFAKAFGTQGYQAPPQQPGTFGMPSQMPQSSALPGTEAKLPGLPVQQGDNDNLRTTIEQAYDAQAPQTPTAQPPSVVAPGAPEIAPSNVAPSGSMPQAQPSPGLEFQGYAPSGNAPAYGTGDPDWQRMQQINRERQAGDIGESGLTQTEQGLMDAFRGASGAGERYSKAWQGLNAMRGDAFQATSNPNVRVGTPEQARARREMLDAARRKPRYTGPTQSLEERIAALRGRGNA